MVVPAVLVLIRGAMRFVSLFQPCIHELGERSCSLCNAHPAATGRQVAHPYRHGSPGGILVREPVLVVLRPLRDPSNRPQLAAAVGSPESLSTTSLLLGHGWPSMHKLHLSYN